LRSAIICFNFSVEGSSGLCAIVVERISEWECWYRVSKWESEWVSEGVEVSPSCAVSAPGLWSSSAQSLLSPCFWLLVSIRDRGLKEWCEWSAVGWSDLRSKERGSEWVRKWCFDGCGRSQELPLWPSYIPVVASPVTY
jgi:hypothetical protein